MRVLLIDDNEMSRTLVRTILSGNGHTIVGECSSGQQGLEQALRLQPELVCLDISMPDADGLDILRQIRLKLPSTQVLMVTGQRDPATAQRCRDNGASGVVVKPFQPAALLAAVSEAQQQPAARAPGREPRPERLGPLRRSMAMLSAIQIGHRLALGFGLILFFTIVIFAAGHYGLRIASQASSHIVEEALASERLVSEWHSATTLNANRTMAVAYGGPEIEQLFASKIKATTARINDIQKQLETMPRSAHEAALFDDIGKMRQDYIKARDVVFAAKRKGEDGQARALSASTLEPALATYLAAIGRLVDNERQDIQVSKRQLEGQFADGRMLLSVITVVALLLSVALTYLITRSITSPLRVAIGMSSAVSRGDLTISGVKVRGSDELSELLWGLKNMGENLGVLVGRVRNSADAIAITSGHIASGSLNLSSRTEQQAAQLEQTASTMEELTSTVAQNAANADQARHLATSASAVATKGGSVVDQVVDTMGAIKASSHRIADIIGVIDGIAFQTNILALNAAVEAARAGEQGRGFAVVASEVRSLAQRSAAAAKEIKALIDDSVERVDQGGELVNQAGATMGEIVSSIREVSHVVGDITNAGREQSVGINQIGDSITHLDKMTQQNAGLVDKSLEATQTLENKARELVEIMSVFQLDRDGRGRANVQERGTVKEAIALVSRASAWRSSCSSRQAFLDGITDPANRFFDKDMYVFGLDRNGTYLAFAGNASKVGSKVQDVPGVDGTTLLAAIIEQGRQGAGWVEYEIVNPANGKLQSKMSYILLQDDIYLGCGIYTSLI